MSTTSSRANAISRRGLLTGAAVLIATPFLGALVGCGTDSSNTKGPGEPSLPEDSSTQASPDAGTSQSVGPADTQAGTYQLDGPFVLGFDQEFPPYGYLGDDGQFTGFDIELAQAVCDALDWELVLEPIDWDAKDALLNSGQITCIWNGFTIETREDDYTFSAPYMENRQVIAVRSDSGIDSLSDLAGKVVLTQTDSAAYSLLAEGGAQADLGATFADLQTLGDYNTAFMELESGQVDALAVDQPVAQFNIAGRTDTLTILEEALNSEHFGIGFKKGNDQLAAAVEQQLRALYADGTVEKLCEKYADQGVSFDLWLLK